MKICICTTPIRPVPTTYPPFGSLAVIQALRKVGEEAEFYNIDYFRYDARQVEAHFAAGQYDVVGISAVVSTAYAYTKFLAQLIRRVSPRTVIVVGGNLAASAEILLRKCGVDICVTGDGENIVQELVPLLREHGKDPSRLAGIKGLCFLDANGEFAFTGYGRRPEAHEIESPDYGILERDGSLDYFLPVVDSHRAGVPAELLRNIQPGKRLATVTMAKGCVARCTFCHRWERGYRARPVDQLIEHLRMLKERYNVGFIDVSDENFGSDREQAWELASALKDLGMTWRAAGVRVRTITRETLQHWADCGCTAVHFGIESGSPKMLRVMEKNANLDQNVAALKATGEVGLETVIQLVLGMPGETDETIGETIEFLKRVHPYMRTWNEETFPSDSISINYAQALPGTPLYEFARERGFIGRTVDEEEQYLLRISDTDAYKEDHFINYTGQPLLKVLTWRPRILAVLDAFHLERNNRRVEMSLWQLARYYAGVIAFRLRARRGFLPQGIGALLTRLGAPADGPSREGSGAGYYGETGYFNIQSGLKFAPLLFNALTRRLFYPILALAMAVRGAGTPVQVLSLIGGHMVWSLRQRFAPGVPDLPDRSLRKVVVTISKRNEDAQDRMLPLRSGR